MMKQASDDSIHAFDPLIFSVASRRLGEEAGRSASDQMEGIARLWSAYLGHMVTEADVAHMMVLLKVGRARSRKSAVSDDYVDICGYAALAVSFLQRTYQLPPDSST